MKISTNKKYIETIVTRGVERVFPNEDFLRSRLSSGGRLICSHVEIRLDYNNLLKYLLFINKYFFLNTLICRLY